ncbi:MAG: hypothetical protein M1838_005036 [Thelocarpon superellum]|nr:MAG: hypothetical protein M1838_005036 [Thelocarpon superellum]
MFGGKSFNPDTDIPDLSGKVILVTGGNTGLGKETVLQMAKHKPLQIFLAARTPSKAEEAIAEIRAAVPSANLTFLPLDLTSLESVAKAATNFKAQSDRLDILFNNAGIMAVPPGTTKDGYEVQFGTNHVGHALLIKLLLPTLLETAKRPQADVRIVNLSSAGNALAPWKGIDFDDLALSKSGTWARYGQSKLANILYTDELAKKFPDITSASIHPGLIHTNVSTNVHSMALYDVKLTWLDAQLYTSNKESNAIVRYGLMVAGGLMMSDVPTGAKNQLWAAVSKDVVSGTYYTPIGVKGLRTPAAKSGPLAAQLWNWTEEELAKHGY